MTTTKTLLLVASVVAAGGSILFYQANQRADVTNRATQAERTQNRKKAVEPTPTAPEAKRFRPAPVSIQTQRAVNEILERHKSMTKRELQKSAELNKLMDHFIAVLSSPEMQTKMEQHIAAIPLASSGGQGSVMLDFDTLDDAKGRAWLEAVVSNDTQRMEDWILNTLDGAVFEFAFDPDLERTSNGVSVKSASEAKSDAPQKPED